jgi:hypothetical protein
VSLGRPIFHGKPKKYSHLWTLGIVAGALVFFLYRTTRIYLAHNYWLLVSLMAHPTPYYQIWWLFMQAMFPEQLMVPLIVFLLPFPCNSRLPHLFLHPLHSLLLLLVPLLILLILQVFYWFPIFHQHFSLTTRNQRTVSTMAPPRTLHPLLPLFCPASTMPMLLALSFQ